jgi:hypothetical protein
VVQTYIYIYNHSNFQRFSSFLKVWELIYCIFFDLARSRKRVASPDTIWCCKHIIHSEHTSYQLDILCETYAVFCYTRESTVFWIQFIFHTIHSNLPEKQVLNMFWTCSCLSFFKHMSFFTDWWVCAGLGAHVRVQLKKSTELNYVSNICSTSPPGGNQIDGLPPVSNTGTRTSVTGVVTYNCGVFRRSHDHSSQFVLQILVSLRFPEDQYWAVISNFTTGIGFQN